MLYTTLERPQVNELYKDKLEILRQRIPIGLRHALTLLEKVDGDLEKAEKQFVEEMIALTISKTGVKSDIAIKHLTKNHFDIGLTIKNPDEECYTVTELIIRKYKDKKENALDKIYLAVEEKHKLERIFWFNFDNLRSLPPEIYSFMTTMEWLNYEGWEGLDSALYFHIETVTEQLRNQLFLPEIAYTLIKAREIHEIQFEQQRTILEKEGVVGPTPEFKKQNDLFEIQRPMLIDKLYDLVKQNIDKYP